MWHVTSDMGLVTRDTWHVSHDTWHVTCCGGWTFFHNFSFLAHSFVRHIFIIIYYATSFKMRIWLDHFGSWKNSENIFGKSFSLKKIYINFTYMSGRFFFVFSIYFVIGPISYKKKLISKFWMSISRSKERWRSYICIPSRAQTHIIAHTQKGAVRKPEQPLFVQKNHFENYQSFSIAD